MAKKFPSKFPGVRFKNHPTRKHGATPDKYFYIRFRHNGKLSEQGLGWASKGWTAEGANLLLGEFKSNAKSGKGPTSFKEQQAIADGIKEAKKKKDDERMRDLLTLGDAVKTYRAWIESETPTVLSREDRILRIQILPFFTPEKYIKEISEEDVREFKNFLLKKGSRQGKPLAPRTVVYCLMVVGKLLKFNSLVNVAAKVKVPKYDNKALRFLSKVEVANLLSKLRIMDIDTYHMAAIAIHLGFRAGEIFALKVMYVDFLQRCVSAVDTKNSKTRTLFMTKFSESILRKCCDGKKPGDLVFPNHTGKQRTEIGGYYSTAVKGLGLNEGIADKRLRVKFHTLRHTYASWLIMSGKVDLYTLQKLLGHQDITTTQRYAHLAPDHYRESAAVMDGEFQGVMLSGVKEKDALDKLGQEID